MRSCGDEVSCEKVWRNLSRFFVHFLPRARSKAFLAYWRFQAENLHIAKDSLWVDAYTIKSLKLHPDIAIALKRGIKEKLNLLCQLRIPRFCKGAFFLNPAIITTP